MSEEGQHEFSESVARLADTFSERLEKFGDSPECAEHSDLETQERRMRYLCEGLDFQNAKILDFGCATGHFLTFIKREFAFQGDYVGYDISEKMISTGSAKFPDARFECRDILASGVQEQFDYIFVSGTFNDLIGDNWKWMAQSLKVLFGACRRTMVFNNLSRYVDYFDGHLFYVDPAKVFQFSKEELSPLVSLRHDYCMKDGVVPYEFTTRVDKSDIGCRSLNLD